MFLRVTGYSDIRPVVLRIVSNIASSVNCRNSVCAFGRSQWESRKWHWEAAVFEWLNLCYHS